MVALFDTGPQREAHVLVHKDDEQPSSSQQISSQIQVRPPEDTIESVQLRASASRRKPNVLRKSIRRRVREQDAMHFDTDIPIPSTSRNSAIRTERRAMTDFNIGASQRNRKQQAVSRSRTSPAEVNVEEKGGNALQKLWGATARALPRIGTGFTRNKRGVPEIVVPTPELQPGGVGLVDDKPSHLHTTKVTEQVSTETKEIERLRRDLSISKHRIAELEQHEARSGDSIASNSFLNIADKSSDSDVIRALQRLNAEIQQSATYLADRMVQDFVFKDITTDLTEELMQRVSSHIGQVLARSLGSKTPEISLLLPIAFQTYLADILCQTASAWAFDALNNSFIDEIYQRLREVEAQATSGRWRSLMRHYNLRQWVNHPEALIKALTDGLSDILLVAGCTAPPYVISSKISSFEERIALLVELAGRLNKIFDEVISCDFELFYARPGDKFEDKNMEETDGDKAAALEGSAVLCVTHLGLRKWAPSGTVWDKGKKQSMVVVKAKVFLESFLDD